MSGHKIRLGKGFSIDKKTGKPKRSTGHLDVSARIKQQKSKRVRVAKRGTTP